MLQCDPFRINRPDDDLTFYGFSCMYEKKVIVLHEHRHVLSLTRMRPDPEKSKVPELIQLRRGRQSFLFGRRRHFRVR